jgi:hypothetical protein
MIEILTTESQRLKHDFGSRKTGKTTSERRVEQRKNAKPGTTADAMNIYNAFIGSKWLHGDLQMACRHPCQQIYAASNPFNSIAAAQHTRNQQISQELSPPSDSGLSPDLEAKMAIAATQRINTLRGEVSFITAQTVTTQSIATQACKTRASGRFSPKSKACKALAASVQGAAR